MYNNILDLLQSKYSVDSIKKEDLSLFSSFFNKENTITLLKDILNNPSLLSKIEERSYTHALGFDKIVIADLSKDIDKSLPKSQVRLHIWDPQKDNSLPIVESLHEHSFDFISTVLTGFLENQQYSFRKEMTHEENKILNDLLMWRELSTETEIKEADHYLEIVEAKRLELYGSHQFSSMYDHMVSHECLHKLSKIMGFSKSEILDIVVNIQGHYISNRVAGEKKSYKHVLDKYVIIKPHNVLSINQEETYFHPYQLPHRLYYDNKVLNSTILLTTPVKDNPEGGSLQRPSYVQKNEQDYNKISYQKNQLKEKLVAYLEYLESI